MIIIVIGITVAVLYLLMYLVVTVWGDKRHRQRTPPIHIHVDAPRHPCSPRPPKETPFQRTKRKRLEELRLHNEARSRHYYCDCDEHDI